jgi:hypothetical protein
MMSFENNEYRKTDGTIYLLSLIVLLVKVWESIKSFSKVLQSPKQDPASPVKLITGFIDLEHP